MSHSCSPTVSVLIPTYKYARYLPQAIESVLNQSFTDFELIASDDDSRDGSEEIIRHYAALDDRIRFSLQSPNLGMVENWNWCLSQARGRYIKYVFGDDYLSHRDALSRLVSLMEAHPNVRLAASARTVVDEDSQSTDVWNHVGRSGIYDGPALAAWTLRFNGNLIGEPSAVLFRRSDAMDGFDASFRQVVDWEFWIRLLQLGTFAYTAEPLCTFRRHAGQQSEVNRRITGTMGEHPRLLRLYSKYLAHTPNELRLAFESLYRLQKKRSLEPEEVEWMKIAREAVGDRYYQCWIRYKINRAPYKASRFWRKHVLRRALPSEPSPQFRAPDPLSEADQRVSGD